MANRAARILQFCRLCLKELDLVYMFSNDALTRMILFNNFPNMYLGRTNFIRLCKDCYSNLDFVMMVKNGFPVKRRDFLRQKLSRVKGVKFCAFCLVFETCAQEVSIFLDDSYGDSRVRKTVEGAISEFKYTDGSTSICNFCWSWIWKIYNFMQQCNRIEHILKLYCDENRLTSLTDTDIMLLLKLNVHMRDLREKIEKNRQNSVDLSQKEFQSYISTAKQNYSKLVVALESNTDYVRMNLDIIRHMEYYFATGEVYPNLKDDAKNKDSAQSTEATTINRHNFVKPYDENGCYAYNINPMALQDSNSDMQNCIPSINLNDSDDEDILVNKGSDDVVFVDNDNTFFGDESKNMKLDIDETNLELQLYGKNNDTDPANNDDDDNNNDSLVGIRSDIDLQPNYLETNMQMAKIDLEIEESKSASKEEAEYDIENDISTFQINSELLTSLIDNNSPKEYLTFEPSTAICDNTDTLNELSEEVEFGKPSDDQQTIDASANALDDDCYEVEMDTSKPIDLTTRPTDGTQLKNYNSNSRDCWGCYVCAAKFRSRRAVVRHTLIHERPWNKFGKFCCRFCPYRANWKGSVTRHENVHAFQNLHAFNRRTTKYLCIFCNVVFRVKGDVQSHMIKHIITWKHFQCLICMFAGNSSEALRLHYRHCHNEKAEMHSLPIRNKLFI